MEITDYHAKYFAHELTKKCPSENIESLIPALMDAQVDLNPHQIEAALFAFQSPLSRGAILADEVGLGKTIEAGILLSQKWAERKRKILIIVPSSLRKQWNRELLEKFFLPSFILESRSFNQMIKEEKNNPFERDEIIISSYHFVRNKAEYASQIQWDLVVIDEAHRLRNVYKPDNKIARCLRDAFKGIPKILLTATPLQNSLMELYGLTSFIDDYAFGDQDSFKSQYSRLEGEDIYQELKARLAPICKRNLRRQVQEYVKYTKRIPITEEFTPKDEEQRLYEMVSSYLQREELKALPKQGRHLITMVLRKILASSTFAVAGALEKIMNRLKISLKENSKYEITKELEEDFEYLEDAKEEWNEEELEAEILANEKRVIENEIKELENFYRLAVSIKENAKGEALLKALELGFKKAQELGALDKAIIFTESKRTQNYLLRVLGGITEYAEKIILFNGSNNDQKSKEVYENWKAKNKDSDLITGSRTADMRSALVDYFKNEAKIMIATEAAAEGINLQFCSLIVNYDLPWNPQRIEQRIGRCHRYGQKQDVVVINFLNRKNAADQRVFELLSQKFKLFEGVFGASDEILGSIESGVDFEKRILEIYQKCRTEGEITEAFDDLQNEMSLKINKGLKTAKQKLIENFDEEVSEKLRVSNEKSRNYLSKHEDWLWKITQYALSECALFEHKIYSFTLNENHPFQALSISSGPYKMGRNITDAHIYRPHHPLAQEIIKQVVQKETPPICLNFNYNSPDSPKISILEPLIGKSGFLLFNKLTVSSFEKEEYLILSALTEGGESLDEEQCMRLFSLPATMSSISQNPNIRESLRSAYQSRKQTFLGEVSKRNSKYFDQEMDKLDAWANDRQESLKENLKRLDKEINDLKKQARQSNNLPEKIALQKKVSVLESKRDEAWKEYDKSSKEIKHQKENLLDQIQNRMEQNIKEETIFEIEWKIT